MCRCQIYRYNKDSDFTVDHVWVEVALYMNGKIIRDPNGREVRLSTAWWHQGGMEPETGNLGDSKSSQRRGGDKVRCMSAEDDHIGPGGRVNLSNLLISLCALLAEHVKLGRQRTKPRQAASAHSRATLLAQSVADVFHDADLHTPARNTSRVRERCLSLWVPRLHAFDRIAFRCGAGAF